MNWTIQYTSDSKYAIIYSGKEKVCEIDIDQNQDGESHVRLIAAAPELFELVEELSENLSLQLNRIGCCDQGDGKDRKGDNDSMGGSEILSRAKTAIKKVTE